MLSSKHNNNNCWRTWFGLLWMMLLLRFTSANVQQQQRQDNNPILLQVRALRSSPTTAARQSVTQLENDFVITFSGDGTPFPLPPIKLLLNAITGDLSNNGRVILGRAFADFLNDELTEEWKDNTEIADLTSVLVDVVKIETVASLPGNKKEMEATLDTTLTFDGLADSPDPTTVNDAVLKALSKMQTFLNNYLLPSELPEFESLSEATATLVLPKEDKKEEKPKKEDKEPKEDKKPAVAQANTSFRSASFDPQDLKILIPSLIGGMAMFLLTAFWLARSRRRQQELSFDSYEDDIDHTVNGSHMGKEEIEVQPANLMDYGYSPDGHVDLNSSYGAGHVAMHIPAMDTSSTMMADNNNPFPNDPFQDHPSSQQHAINNNNTRNARSAAPPPRNQQGQQQQQQQQQQQLYNRGSVIDSPSMADSSATSDYSEGKYWS